MKDFLIISAILIGIFAVTTLVLVGIDVWQFHYHAVEGEHNVVLTAVERTKINTTVYAKTEGESSQEDTYCIHNPYMPKDEFNRIQTFVKTKQNVMLNFSQEYKLFPWECRDIVSVEAL